MNSPYESHLDVWRTLQDAEAPAEFFASWLRCLVGPAGLIRSVDQALLIWGDSPNIGPFRPVALWPEELTPDAELAGLCERVLDMRLPLQKTAQDSPTLLWASPLMLGGELLGVLALRCQGALPDRMSHWLQWGTGWLAEHAMRAEVADDHAARDRLILTLDLLTRLFEGKPAHEVAQAIATEIAQRLGCERVSIGFGDLQKVHLFALSHSADFSRRIDLSNAIELAMAEAGDHGEVIRLLGDESSVATALTVREHRRLQRDFDSAAVVSVPFCTGEETGVFIFEWVSVPDSTEQIALAEALAPVIGRTLIDYRRLTKPWPARLRDGIAEHWKKLIGPQEGKRKVIAGVSLTVLLFLIFAHGEFRLAAPSRLEGGIRRVIVAPFDGFVASSVFRAGQVVKQGGVLATLDDRELRLEGSRWDSQQSQFAKQAQDAQAQHNLAQLQISLAQSRQAEAQRDLNQTMLERSQIKAPFDGIIVAGDLSQQLGAAVKKGQTLYEIAPLDSYRVILNVDEVDMPHVRVGQKGELIVAALPAERFPFLVTLVTPVAEAKEGKNAFRVEATLEEQNLHLRPGMEGVGKIDAGQRHLVWIWTHRFFDWLRLQTWVWLGF